MGNDVYKEHGEACVNDTGLSIYYALQMSAKTAQGLVDAVDEFREFEKKTTLPVYAITLYRTEAAILVSEQEVFDVNDDADDDTIEFSTHGFGVEVTSSGIQFYAYGRYGDERITLPDMSYNTLKKIAATDKSA